METMSAKTLEKRSKSIFAGSEFVKRDPPVVQVIFEVGQVRVLTKKLKVVFDSPISSRQDSVSGEISSPHESGNGFSDPIP